MSRSGALKKGMIVSFIGELVTIISGLILPRLILVAFGSSCNGMLSAIVQFLGFSTVFRAGVGAVTRAALFKPLASKNYDSINEILAATNSYMYKISALIGAYILAVGIIYPFATAGEYSWWEVFSLTLIIGSSTLIDNLFGIKYRILLQADQKYYIETACVIVSQLASLGISVLLINFGANIHVVKIGAALAALLNPIILITYAKIKYRFLNLNVKPNGDAIKQRWDAFAQQMAMVVNGNVGLVLLSFFVKLKEISVYTVHYMICHNMEKLVVSTIGGVSSTFGDMIANGEEENLRNKFYFVEWLLFAVCAVLFSVTAVMITPFITIYTDGITDTDYIRPLFAFALTAAAMLNCMRRPYQMLAESAGCFKQTRNSAILEVVLNIIVSFVFVYFFGVIGVAIGAIVSTLYRTMQLAIYSMKHILNFPFLHLLKTYFLYMAAFVGITFVCNLIPHPEMTNYLSWAVFAIVIVVAAVLLVLLVSLIFNREQLFYLIKRMTAKFRKKSVKKD